LLAVVAVAVEAGVGEQPVEAAAVVVVGAQPVGVEEPEAYPVGAWAAAVVAAVD
jgi:hypothetical protein